MNQDATNATATRTIKHAGSFPTITPTPGATPQSSVRESETLHSQSAAPEKSSVSEHRLVVMWRKTSANSKAASLSQKKVRELKAKLAEALFAYKQELAGHGREGRWSAFLREADIPLSTADRYVERHRKLVEPTNKVLTEELTVEEIESLGKKICILLSRANTKGSRAALLKRIDLKLRELRG